MARMSRGGEGGEGAWVYIAQGKGEGRDGVGRKGEIWGERKVQVKVKLKVKVRVRVSNTYIASLSYVKT